jgi:PEP-CTERM motif
MFVVLILIQQQTTHFKRIGGATLGAPNVQPIIKEWVAVYSETSGASMPHKMSILALLGLAVALLVAAPANADLIHEHQTGDLERDADSAPHYWHEVHLGENLKLNEHRFERDHFKGDNSYSGAPNTAEWIWWLNHSDNDKNEFAENPNDAVVTAPEPASLFLLGSGVLALGAWRRRANHSAPIS